MTLRSAFLIALLFFVGVGAVVLVALRDPSRSIPSAPIAVMATSTATSTPVASTTPSKSTSSPIAKPAAPVKSVPKSDPIKPPVKTTPVASVSTTNDAPIPAPAVATIAAPPKSAPVEPQPPAIIHVATTSAAVPAPDTTGAALTAAGIFSLTNEARITAGLPPLAYNVKLETMAGAKNTDMISKQYFAHVSPDGVGIGDLAERYGYDFRHVGENLALGDFTSNTHVVKGWMDSPGHRANILGQKFTEVGISAVRGNYQGREVWYAVQEFGTPLPDCPAPDESLRREISTLEPKTDELSATLAT
ncbi:MAG TPA: CAP domain-containing protein, partial [Candidatus Paceibacterota bacterium]|nr:CAP domain-containing protein [Candidatus Paceibacterota bacterium]